MGKLTQAWQADDGQFFETEGEMLGHERDVQVERLGESWNNFVASCASVNLLDKNISGIVATSGDLKLRGIEKRM